MGACLCKTKRRSAGDHLPPTDLFHSGLSSASSSSSSSSSSTSSSSSSSSSSTTSGSSSAASTISSNATSPETSCSHSSATSATSPGVAVATTAGHRDHQRQHLHSHNQSHSHSHNHYQSRQSSQRSNGLFDALALTGSQADLSHYLSHKNILDSLPNGHYLSNNLPGVGGNNNNNSNRIWSLQNKLSLHSDRLVVETLESIKPTALNEPSNAMQKLHLISETEIGWLVVINSLINKVDLEHPFGSALILLILEDAPLPTRKSINQLDEVLGLSICHERSVAKQRNISIVLGCLAEKLAGTFSSVLFSSKVQDYLLSRIEADKNEPIVILYSLIALEKFSQTIDNKLLIMKRLHQLGTKNPLLQLESKFAGVAGHQRHQAKGRDFIEQQVGFCATWDLDNHFLYDGRPYSYETIDRDNLNTMLNSRDASENLKISADGLVARNDTSRFESVRCTAPVTSGIYYYEVRLITPGVMQIGFATKQSKFLNHDGFGIGDDDQSLAYDGCRQLVWQNAKSQQTSLPRWKEGDIVGCLIDLDKFEIIFSLNGQMSAPNSDLFRNKPLSTQYYAAASFMPFQQCAFNFGRVPFVHPPEQHNFRTFNQCATPLKEDEKIIIPRHLILKKVHSSNMFMNTCNICCDNMAQITLEPCEHDGFCETCASLLELCPLCRTSITSRRFGVD